MKLKVSKIRSKKTTILFILGFLIFVGFLFWSDLPQTKEVFKQFQPIYFLPILALSLVNYFLRFLKWQVYLITLGLRIERGISLAIFFSGLAFSITPAKLGEVFKSHLLKKRYQIPISQTAPIVVIDRLTDFISVLFLAGLGIMVFKYGLIVFIFCLLIIGLLLVFLSSRKIADLFLNFFSRFRYVSSLIPYFKTAWKSSILMTKSRPLILTTIISFFAWSAECFGFWLVFRGLGIYSVSLLSAFFVYAFSTLLGAISMVPGGLGVQEAFMAGLLTTLSQNKAQATAATLIIRACTLWFAVLLGGLVLIFLYSKLRDKNEN